MCGGGAASAPACRLLRGGRLAACTVPCAAALQVASGSRCGLRCARAVERHWPSAKQQRRRRRSQAWAAVRQAAGVQRAGHGGAQPEAPTAVQQRQAQRQQRRRCSMRAGGARLCSCGGLKLHGRQERIPGHHMLWQHGSAAGEPASSRWTKAISQHPPNCRCSTGAARAATGSPLAGCRHPAAHQRCTGCRAPPHPLLAALVTCSPSLPPARVQLQAQRPGQPRRHRRCGRHRGRCRDQQEQQEGAPAPRCAVPRCAVLHLRWTCC